jgi:hypothetical protein
MAGRKPLLTHLKLVKGTARPHRINSDAPKPIVTFPQPPELFDDRARSKLTSAADPPEELQRIFDFHQEIHLREDAAVTIVGAILLSMMAAAWLKL